MSALSDAKAAALALYVARAPINHMEKAYWELLAAGGAVTNRAINTGTATPTGAVSLSFIIPHGVGAVPSFVQVRPSNALAAAVFYTTADATNITVTYLAPITGLVSLSWMAIA